MWYKVKKAELKHHYSFSESADDNADKKDEKTSFNMYDGDQVLKLIRRVSKKLEIQNLEDVLILEEILSTKTMNLIDKNQVQKWLIKEYKKKKLMDLL
jgi:hypothetical protein